MPAPLNGRKLTPAEKTFVTALTETDDRQYAAVKAGWGTRYANQRAYEALNRPEVQAAIREEQALRLNADLLPKAVAAIERILTDKAAPSGAVVQAAKLVFDRTLGVQGPGDGKEPWQLTGEELAKGISALRAEIEERRRVTIDVSPTPDIDPMA